MTAWLGWSSLALWAGMTAALSASAIVNIWQGDGSTGTLMLLVALAVFVFGAVLCGPDWLLL